MFDRQSLEHSNAATDLRVAATLFINQTKMIPVVWDYNNLHVAIDCNYLEAINRGNFRASPGK